GNVLDRVIRYSIERHKTRRELEILNATLEQRVAERTRELAGAYDSLDKAHRNLREMDRIKAAFIDVMSHELRTPLATILGALPILQKKAETDAPGLLAFLKSARSAARRLERLTYNALKVAEEGDYTRRLAMRFISADEIVLRALQEIQPFLDLRCQQVRSVIPEAPLRVLADANMIHDALTNLLMNAIKFTPDGGSITVSVRAVEQDGVEFRVSDTGIGVSEEDKPHLFEMLFASLDVNHHSSGEYEFQKRGMGMGLAMVKKFVEMHGGRVGFESEKGKGSEFYFILPNA
ncbi:MAG: HAMP domain-containing sensor histidine kinase, partial [Candidatus Sumerlaeota bacterium]|nr:HAMP domain-containing sensor histidine kinase [Candidatus Sumerlaeota bacterium]